MATREVQIAALKEALEAAVNLSNLYFEAWSECLQLEHKIREQLAQVMAE